MVCRQGPQLPSLMQDKAFEADEVMRPKAADSHQGQGREKSRNRPDRFVHSTLSAPTDRLAREASIDSSCTTSVCQPTRASASPFPALRSISPTASIAALPCSKPLRAPHI